MCTATYCLLQARKSILLKWKQALTDLSSEPFSEETNRIISETIDFLSTLTDYIIAGPTDGEDLIDILAYHARDSEVTQGFGAVESLINTIAHLFMIQEARGVTPETEEGLAWIIKKLDVWAKKCPDI